MTVLIRKGIKGMKSIKQVWECASIDYCMVGSAEGSAKFKVKGDK